MLRYLSCESSRLVSLDKVLDVQRAVGWLSGESQVDPRVVVIARAVVEDGVVDALHIAIHECAHRRRREEFPLVTLVFLLHLPVSFVTTAAAAGQC